MRSDLLKHLSELSRYLYAGTASILLLTAGIQALTFVLLARGLGVDSFGRLTVLQAMTQLALGLVSIGSGEALIRRVARDRTQYPSALGYALVLTVSTGVAIGTALPALASWSQPGLSVLSIWVYVVGELLGNRFGVLAGHALIAHSQIGRANSVHLMLAALKLGFVIFGMYGLGINDLATWMLIQGSTTLLIGLVFLGLLVFWLGPPIFAFRLEDLSFGALITATGFANSIQFSADRIVLSMVAPPSVVAVYSVATRGVQFGLIPTSAILRNLYPGFFALGANGIAAAQRYALSNLSKIIAAGLLTATILFVAADLVSAVMGRGFSNVPEIIRWLAAVPLLQGIQFLLADALTGSDHQIWRTITSVAGALAYVIAIGVLAYSYGIFGLIAAVYFCQLAMILTYATIFRALASRQPA